MIDEIEPEIVEPEPELEDEEEPTPEDISSFQKKVKTSGIVSKCDFRRRWRVFTNDCYILSGIPEPIGNSCPCWYFKCTDKDANKKFNDMCEKFKCVSKLKKLSKHKKGVITFFDLIHIQEFKWKKDSKNCELSLV